MILSAKPIILQQFVFFQQVFNICLGIGLLSFFKPKQYITNNEFHQMGLKQNMNIDFLVGMFEMFSALNCHVCGGHIILMAFSLINQIWSPFNGFNSNHPHFT